MINLINDKSYKNIIKIMLYHNNNYDHFYFNKINENLNNDEFIEIVKEFNFTILKSCPKNLKVYEYFLTQSIDKKLNYNNFKEIYQNYIIANYTEHFNTLIMNS